MSSSWLQVEKATMTEGMFPEPGRVRPKERGGRWGHASPFMRSSNIVRSQTFSPGARSQYVCRVGTHTHTHTHTQAFSLFVTKYRT